MMNNTITAQEAINLLGKISKARYLAMDNGGVWGLFINKPSPHLYTWNVRQKYKNSEPVLDDTKIYLGSNFLSIQPAENWKESLVKYQP